MAQKKKKSAKGKRASVAATPARKTALLQRRLREAEAVMDIAAALADTKCTLDQKLEQCLALVLKQFEAERGSIMLIDRLSAELVVRASIPSRVLGFRQPLDGTSVSAMVAKKGKVMNCSAPGKCGTAKGSHQDYKKSAFIAYPIIAPNGVMGVFNLTEKKKGAFTRHDEKALARFIDRIAVTIENAELHDQLGQSERDLREAKETYRLLVDTAPDPIVIHDGTAILYANAACARLTGRVSQGALTGKSPLDYIHPDSHRLFEEGSRMMAADSTAFPRMELKLLAAGDEVRDMEAAAVAVKYDGKRAQQVVFRDITERKRGEMALRCAKEEAEAATALKDKFVTLVSHDLKTPLGALISLLRLLHRSWGARLEGQEAGMLDRAIDSADTMQKMITRLLDISLLQTGRIMLKKRFIEMHDFAGDLMASMGPVAESKGLVLRHDVPHGIRLYADRDLLWEMIGNLISNAIKFTPSGGAITIGARLKDGVEITVADQGVGIKKETIPLLFRHDVRTSTRGTAGEKGTGLGLSLCHEIVLAHGGSIGVASEAGRGTTFTIVLPHVSPDILVVEDNNVDMFVIQRFLEPLDVNLIKASAVEEALASIAARPPHLIIMDLHLGAENGLALLKALHGDPATANLPVIVITNDTSIETREKAFTGGARDFVTKPLQSNDFIPRVKRFLY